MKLSLAWIFDHIEADWKTIDVDALINQFCVKTAEVEGFQKVSLDFDALTLARITAVKPDHIELYSFEWKKEISLPLRSGLHENDTMLVRREGKEYQWAIMQDLNSEKDALLSPFWCTEDQLAGGWKKELGAHDYILEIDNIAITNRPDMWCHRGFAREMAALLKVPLKPLDDFLAPRAVHDGKNEIKPTERMPVRIALKAPEECKRFAGLYIDSISYQASTLKIAHRLAKVDAKPIDLLVDLTNYVMFDISQPLHVFDTEKLSSKEIVPRLAKKGETIQLLDGQEINLHADDLVIADGMQPIALAGIMGGASTGEGPTTCKIFVEAAWFNPSAIRRTATRYRIRTESSARFEKGLDPNQNILGLKRFYKLLEASGIEFGGASDIASIGDYAHDHTIEVSHAWLEKRIGASLQSDFVTSVLDRLGFHVVVVDAKPIVYVVTVPTFRSHVTLSEDILEEVARFFGYTNIPAALPLKPVKPTDVRPLFTLRTIKNHMAYALNMHEVSHYSLFDEHFLKSIKWQPENPVAIINPVSENWKHLLTTLVPHMLKAVSENSASHAVANFFEWGRIWHRLKKWSNDQKLIVGTGPFVHEEKRLAGIFYSAQNGIDFYQAKQQLNSLFYQLKISVEWVKSDKSREPWYHQTQTASLVYEGVVIGTAGMAEPLFFANVAPGNAFIFELNGDFLINYKSETVLFDRPSKFPRVWQDVSMLVPLKITVATITQAITHVDDRISSAELIDRFERKEWKDKKSVTFRFVIADKTKTLTKDEIDQLFAAVQTAVTKLGAQVR